MQLSWQVLILFLGLVQLGLAALNIPSLPRWSWFPGGSLFIALALFFRVG